MKEVSGVARNGSTILVVSDEKPGAYFAFDSGNDAGPLIRIKSSVGAEQPLVSNEIKKCLATCGTKVPEAVRLALDLESIDVMPDGTVVVLSERLRGIIDQRGDLIAQYPDTLTEFGERGLEGLAVRDDTTKAYMCAVLWEGGYVEFDDMPAELRGVVGRRALSPVVLWHGPGAVDPEHKKVRIGRTGVNLVELRVPHPESYPEPLGQRFRATDIVWHTWNDGSAVRDCFIVLLNSQNSPRVGRTHFGPRWLQRFDLEGRPIDSGLDLDDYVVKKKFKKVPGMAQLRNANWEGLGWFEQGKSLILTYDDWPGASKSHLECLVVTLPSGW